MLDMLAKELDLANMMHQHLKELKKDQKWTLVMQPKINPYFDIVDSSGI